MAERNRGVLSGAENRRLDEIEERLGDLDEERKALCEEQAAILAKHPEAQPEKPAKQTRSQFVQVPKPEGDV